MLLNLCRLCQGGKEDEDEEFTSGIGQMTDKPFSDGRKYVDSGFVHDLTDTKTDDYYYVKAHVWPSMNTDFPHNVLVVLSVKSRAVVHASGDPCKVSELGRCSHVVAVLLSRVGHVHKHGTITTTPCTSQECTWNKGKKWKKTPQRLSTCRFQLSKTNIIKNLNFGVEVCCTDDKFLLKEYWLTNWS